MSLMKIEVVSTRCGSSMPSSTRRSLLAISLYLALPPAVARNLPEALQRLIGYELKGSMTLGWLDGRDPRHALEDPLQGAGPARPA